MWIADGWKDYEVLDTGDGQKLERWGEYILIRPDPQVIWPKTDERLWKSAHAHYHRSEKGGGSWEIFDLPQQWQISYGHGNSILNFMLKPLGFKHTGLFPEQAANWDWCMDIISHAKALGRDARVLNLFAYTGAATLAALSQEAAVTHVDASKGMVGWAKENASISGLSEAPVRWLVDDCSKFVKREIRREHVYDAIIMDPPSYGRGPSGEIWKIEEKIYELIADCEKLLSDTPLFFLVNSYTTGLQAGVLQYIIDDIITRRHGGVCHADEIGLPIRSGGVLPCGCSGRWTI